MPDFVSEIYKFMKVELEELAISLNLNKIQLKNTQKYILRQF
jgi:hypothetical protein